MTIHLADQPLIRLWFPSTDDECKFTKVLKSRREEEHSTFELDCAIERADGEVTWYYNDVEITPRNNDNFDHFEFIEERRKRWDIKC